MILIESTDGKPIKRLEIRKGEKVPMYSKRVKISKFKIAEHDHKIAVAVTVSNSIRKFQNSKAFEHSAALQNNSFLHVIEIHKRRTLQPRKTSETATLEFILGK